MTREGRNCKLKFHFCTVFVLVGRHFELAVSAGRDVIVSNGRELCKYLAALLVYDVLRGRV